MLKNKFSRNLNYKNIFTNIISEFQSYVEKQIEKINEQNKLLYEAAKLDYELKKLNFDSEFNELKNAKFVLGVSGGMDSTIICFLTSLIFGSENLYALSLPTAFNSEKTKDIASKLPRLLKNNFEEKKIDIEDDDGENGQALKRALILQKKKYSLERELKNSCVILLNTSNLSEIKLGNFTINGDTIGDFGPIRKLYKSEIYQLVAWICSDDGKNYIRDICKNVENFDDIIDCLSEVSNIIPSAELKNNQTDSHVLLYGDFFYKISDMILIAKDNGIIDNAIIDELKKDNVFIDWVDSFYPKANHDDMARYSVEKVNGRVILGVNKIFE